MLLGGCDPFTAIVGTGTVIGGAAADERGVSGVMSDTDIRIAINMRWLNEASELLNFVTLSVQQGQVLLTGVVESRELKKKAVDLIRSVPGIKKIIDQIQVGDTEDLRDYGRDSRITAELRVTLLSDSYIASRNYSLRTVNRVIYITGIAQNQAELDRVLYHAYRVEGVRRVVPYVKIKPLKTLPPVIQGEAAAVSGDDPNVHGQN
jgi:osmotically-inducible protein OsmY